VAGYPYLPSQSADAPAEGFAAISLSDSGSLPFTTRGIYVGVAGDVVAVNSAGTAVTFKNAVAGSVLRIMAVRVNSTGTTATNLVALY